jgi:hypothetical protein
MNEPFPVPVPKFKNILKYFSIPVCLRDNIVTHFKRHVSGTYNMELFGNHFVEAYV